MTNSSHPGLELKRILDERGISQRELSSKINIAQPLLNGILKGVRNINVNIAISLEAADIETAMYWLEKQMEYNFNEAKQDKVIQRKEEDIKSWNKLSQLLPLNYLKKQEFLNINSSEDVDKVFNLYDSTNVHNLDKQLKSFNPKYFRKSSKFKEDKINVFTWSVVAEEKARILNVGTFDRSKEQELIYELKECLLKNKKTVSKTSEILRKYGIKFFILDRPSKTPVEGKSFLSGANPAISLTLKYKRLDNFAFTLFHELGHVFCHLTNPNKAKYKDVNFYTNNSINSIEEFEADKYAQDNLIDRDIWDDFIYSNDSFNDDVIIEFSNKINVHRGIVRGRVCHEFPEYWKKRTSITASNRLDTE